MHGIILRAVSGFFYVSSNDKIYECKARGNFRKTGVSPLVGDRVNFTVDYNNKGIIEQILIRKNFLRRPAIANIDKLLIVSAFATPSPDTLMIDRLTAIAFFHNIEPIIVFNKCDMGNFDEFEKIYSASGFKTYIVSASTGLGMEAIKNEIKNCICAFAGNSGVGKSSILNSVFPELSLRVGEVSKSLGRGRHTTRHTELYPHNYNGYIADTPGFSSIELEENSYEFKLNLCRSFPDIYEHSSGCRFTSCNHICEKGCSVLEAIDSGNIMKSRHNSYKALFEELKDIKAWSK